MTFDTAFFRSWRVVAFVLCALLIAVVGPQRPAIGAEERHSSTIAKANLDFGKLKGRWLRPDGGYVLAIKDIDSEGKMDAAYYNPRQINVSIAQTTREGATLQVFIELQDVGYPGSTYTLTYDAKADQLGGVYYQAAVGQSFDVFFVRAK